jgi:threonine synthase
MVELALVCTDCRERLPFSQTLTVCPTCHSEWLEVQYDYAALARRLPGNLLPQARGLWSYRELLPIRDPANIVTLGEGNTPLLPVTNLGLMLGHQRLYIKDERHSPTGSFKDRQASLVISSLKEAGITEAVVASTGNVAISYAAYCARAGIKLYAFLTSLVPAEKMRECALYGAQVIKVTTTYDQSKELAQQFARQRNLFCDRGLRSFASIEGMKTIAYETAEQLAQWLPPLADRHVPWRAPDWYIQSVSGGLGPVGVAKGYRELYQMGLTDRIPALACIQAEGCAPMANAFRKGLSEAEIVSAPRTHIATLATGNPGRGYQLLKEHIAKYGGVMASISDEDAYRAVHVLAKMEGLSMEPAAAVAFAGLFQLIQQGTIQPQDVVVINCTGHTLPIQTEILGEGWAHDLDLEMPLEQPPTTRPEEGLLAALDRLDERVRSIAIIDDNQDAIRLIRRILQTKGSFQVYEANNGQAGLALIQERRPDLVVLDLMMPEMDGFAVLDALRADKTTRDIPVIVVTAKELTPSERERLAGQINSLLQKGSFMDNGLLDDIAKALT